MAKHEDISRELRNDIATGLYSKTGKLPSEAQLVERFGVSRPTAARALRELQEDGLIERRAGSGSFVKDKPMAAPRTTDVLGLLFPERGSVEIFDTICGELRTVGTISGGRKLVFR